MGTRGENGGPPNTVLSSTKGVGEVGGDRGSRKEIDIGTDEI